MSLFTGDIIYEESGHLFRLTRRHESSISTLKHSIRAILLFCNGHRTWQQSCQENHEPQSDVKEIVSTVHM